MQIIFYEMCCFYKSQYNIIQYNHIQCGKETINFEIEFFINDTFARYTYTYYIITW